MENPAYYIIDFDSTFVTLECLDELAAITLKNNPKKDEILKQISEITTQGMEGKINFSESLEKRLSLFKTNKSDIEKLIKIIKKHITPSVKNNKSFFKKFANQIYIISGGFKEYIVPIAKSFGIPEDHILANTFIFDKKIML